MSPAPKSETGLLFPPSLPLLFFIAFITNGSSLSPSSTFICLTPPHQTGHPTRTGIVTVVMAPVHSVSGTCSGRRRGTQEIMCGMNEPFTEPVAASAEARLRLTEAQVHTALTLPAVSTAPVSSSPTKFKLHDPQVEPCVPSSWCGFLRHQHRLTWGYSGKKDGYARGRRPEARGTALQKQCQDYTRGRPGGHIGHPCCCPGPM